VSRLTDYDHGVLAALQMGLCVKYQKNLHNSAARFFWKWNGVDITPSLVRLEQAAQLYIRKDGDILFPGTEAFHQEGLRAEITTKIRRMIRLGQIKIAPAPKKGTKR
jgi:hypothetical protein